MAKLGVKNTVGSDASARDVLKKEVAARSLAALSAQDKTQQVCTAGPLQIQQVMDELIADGEAVYEDETPDEDSETDLESDELDGEVSLADEDAEPVEMSETTDCFADGSSPFIEDDVFEILVEVEDDFLVLEDPENDWEGVRPISPLAKKCVTHVSNRMQTYREIVKYLQEDGLPQLLSKGPAGFVAEYCPIRQTDFRKRLKGVDKGSFSRYLHNARLTWREGSIPLRSLFSE